MKKITVSLLVLAMFLPTIGFVACEENTLEWTLVSGTEPYADPNPLVYSGNVELHGYMEMAVVYAEDQELQFRVMDEDLKKFPEFNKRKYFRLFYKDENVKDVKEVLDKLQKYDERNPATIKVSGLVYMMEGSPKLTLSEIIE
jgi:hypothetical protein